MKTKTSYHYIFARLKVDLKKRKSHISPMWGQFDQSLQVNDKVGICYCIYQSRIDLVHDIDISKSRWPLTFMYWPWPPQIPVTVDLPVGHNLQDHLWFDVPIATTAPVNMPMKDRQSILSLIQFFLLGTGLSVDTFIPITLEIKICGYPVYSFW